MRLLVTRPTPDAERTAGRLRELGHEAILAPMLEAEPIPLPGDLAAPAALLVTSARAIEALVLSPASGHWRDVPLFCVGDHTAETASAAGFENVHSASGDAADLARLVAATLSPDIGKLLYLSAAEPAGDLAGDLSRAGFSVEPVAVYAMRPVPELPQGVRTRLAEGTIDGVLLYSRRTALTFRRHAEIAGLVPALAAMRFYVLSPTVGSALEGGMIIVAAAPNEAALFELLGEEPGTSAAGIR